MTRMRWDRMGRTGFSIQKAGLIISVGLGGDVDYGSIHAHNVAFDAAKAAEAKAKADAIWPTKRKRTVRRQRKTYKIKRMGS